MKGTAKDGQKDGHEQLQAMLDRIDKDLEDRPRHDFAGTDRGVRYVTKAQMAHYRIAGYVSLVGVITSLSLPLFIEIKWYWSIPIALIWVIVWTQASNRAISSIARFRVRRLAIKEFSGRRA